MNQDRNSEPELSFLGYMLVFRLYFFFSILQVTLRRPLCFLINWPTREIYHSSKCNSSSLSYWIAFVGKCFCVCFFVVILKTNKTCMNNYQLSRPRRVSYKKRYGNYHTIIIKTVSLSPRAQEYMLLITSGSRLSN